MSDLANRDEVRSGRQTCGVNLSTKHLPHGGSDTTSKCPSFYIRTFGCQMNVRDSEVIAGLLARQGSQVVSNESEADVIIYNTCSVRQHAEDKVWSEIGRIVKQAARDNGRGEKRPLIGLVGCMAKNYKEKIFERTPEVDFVVGPADIHKIPEIIKTLMTSDQRPTTERLFRRKIWETEGDIRPAEIYHTGFYADKKHSYVVISEGCSNFCSYCVVPYVRGELRNRNYQDILREIEEAIDKGITKITLLGQNVNAYKSQASRSANWCKGGIPPSYQVHLAGTSLPLGKLVQGRDPALVSGVLGGNKSGVDFVKLLKFVDDIKGLREFSFITSHPKDTSIELFKAMADCEKLQDYLHLPVQSGSDRILKLMNRGYTKEFYLDLTKDYRKIVKNGRLTTDIIVGFPTETERDFLETYDLLKGVQFDAAYIFKYSVRLQTAAANMVDDVPREEKERRHALILELQKSISKKKKC